jgi:hypothetical protein
MSQGKDKVTGILRAQRKPMRIQRASSKSAYEKARADMSFDDVLADARKYFATHDICVDGIEMFFRGHGMPIKISRDAGNESATHGLIVLADLSVPVNGIIVDTLDNFKVLVNPMPDVVRDESALQYCLKSLSEYSVYRALDGTRVSLYYVARANAWLMATARSYDARDYKWVGPKSYLEAFKECAGADFPFDTLDKGAVYSFIFRHHDFHPFVRDPQFLMQVDGPVLTGVAQYAPMPREEVPCAEKLQFLARTAFVDHARDGTCNYGYIFRKKEAGSPAAVYLESALHEFIRKQMYDIPSTIAQLTNETRPVYLHLRGYMSLGSNHAHVIMFPRASCVYSKMDYVVSLLTDLTIAEMRASGKTTRAIGIGSDRASIGEGLFGAAWNPVRDMIGRIARGVAAQLAANGSIGAFGDHIHANIRDQYLSATNMSDFMTILTMK